MVGTEGHLLAGSRLVDRFKAYLPWNEAIADVIYGDGAAGQPVFLDLEDDVLHAIAERVGLGLADPREALLEAVRSTLNRAAGGQSLFASQLAMLGRWDRASGDPPPVLGLLAALSLAALDMRGADGFAASNYYDRLMPVLGIESEAGKGRAVRSYHKASVQLWDALNDWLLDWEGERGLPTAYALNPSHAHVGRPMSQALLRATDRERLRDLFGEFHLPPRSHLSHVDMEVLLEEWIDRPVTSASHALRLVWSQPEARDRITECACQLLEAWDGRFESHGDGNGARRLLLLAGLSGFPSSSLELNVAATQNGSAPDEVQLLDGPNPTGIVLPVEEVPGSRWRLADPSGVDARSMLEGRLRLMTSAELVYERRPRRLVPFRKDTILHAYLELERMPLGESALLLCKAEMVPALLEALALVARPGFRQRADVAGCPEGWAVFSDVQILADLPETNPSTGQGWRFELNVLQPIASSQLALEGGMHLPGRLHRWSTLSPPEVVVVSDSPGALQIHLGRQQGLNNTVLHTREFDSSPAVWPLEELQLGDGDYQVVVVNGDDGARRHAESRALRLRSADMPWTAQELRLTRQPGDAEGVLGATSHEIEGAYIVGPELVGAAARLDDLPADTDLPGWWSARNSSDTNGAAKTKLVVIPAADAADCFHTGAHLIQLPTFYGKRTAKIIKGVCGHCGLVKRYPTRLGRTVDEIRPRARLRVTLSAPRFDPGTVDRISSDGTVRVGVAYDALCHLGSGTPTHLEQLAVQVEPTPLFVDAVLRGLESLGHLEVERHHRTLSPGRWAVVPPTLAELPSGSFVLVGRRNRRLIDGLQSVSAQLGGELDFHSQQAAPDRVRLRGISLDDAKLLVAEVSERLAVTVGVVPDAGRTLAATLPPLSTVLAMLPRQAAPAFRSAKRWDHETARWHASSDASSPGIYQLASVTTMYCLRDEQDIRDGTIRRGDARLVKHLAALQSGHRLVGYDERSCKLYMPLGAELPVLYGRAATLASGVLPENDPAQGLLAYRSVPQDLAACLMRAVMT